MFISKDIYVTGDRKFIRRKFEELYTPIECSKGFNGTLKCVESGFTITPYAHCKVTCRSRDWTYFYLYNTAWHDNTPVKIYVSPMTPTKTSKVMNEIKCSVGYNVTTKECISSSDYSTYISLVCKINCTSNMDSIMFQSENIFNYENGKHYEDEHIINSSDPWP